MYSLPIDNGGVYYIPQSIPSSLSEQCIAEIDKLLEGKMVNGSRRTNRYGAKAFGHFGPFERSPLPPLFQSVLSHILTSNKSQFDTIQTSQPSESDWNQVEIVKLAAGTKYFFDIDQEQQTQGPQLFVNLSGLHPINLYSTQSNTTINTTLAPTIGAVNKKGDRNPEQTQNEDDKVETVDQNDQTNNQNGQNDDTYPPLSASSILLSPDTLGCLVLSQDANQRYAKQIKAQSYRTKQLPVDLTPVAVQNSTISTQTTPSQPLHTTSLVQDFSILLSHGKQKHTEKKAARLAWLQEQIATGKMTTEEMTEQLRRDGPKDGSIESTFAETETSNSGHMNQFVSTKTSEYVLTVPTHTYKRAVGYALIFRSFIKHTPLPDSPLTAENEAVQDGDATTTESTGTVSKLQRKQYIEKQQRANKAVPPITVSLEDMSEDQLYEFEKKHVHSVYDNIADHFSGTRYQAWPQVDEFVQNIAPNTIMADIGCGNGKYLSVNPKITTIGCDISFNLLKLAHDRGCNVAVGDSLAVPLRSDAFDNTISIAVLHHIASRSRRIKAINEMLRVTRPGGKVLITVWAKEQDGSGGRIFTQGDVWVPFKTSTGSAAELERQREKRAKEKEEYKKAHFKDITLENPTTSDLPATTSTTNTATTTDDNTKVEIDAQLPEDVSQESTRFYHVFCQGEIEDHVNDPAIAYPMSIDRVFYGKGNWCIIMTRLEGEKK